MRQVTEDLRQQPVRVLLRERASVYVGDDLECRQGTRAQRPVNSRESLMHELAAGGDVREHVGERAAVPREAQARPQPFYLLQRAQELPDGAGCEVEVR